jgi:hypothetical protein
MLRTDSLEKKPDSFCAGSIVDESCAEDRVADFITITSDPEGRAGKRKPQGRDSLPEYSSESRIRFCGRPKLQAITASATLSPHLGDHRQHPEGTLF